jgi:hypothetical protein
MPVFEDHTLFNSIAPKLVPLSHATGGRPSYLYSQSGAIGTVLRNEVPPFRWPAKGIKPRASTRHEFVTIRAYR